MNKHDFLNFTYNNKHINDTDKTEILSLFTGLKTYKYQDVFSPDLISKTRNITSHDYHDEHHYFIRKVAICENKNRIFKIWVTNKENPFTNDICDQMLIEFYFHNMFFNSITSNILIVPETYKYGKVISDANNEILYFYEMEYYDTTKYVLDIINKLDDESKLHKIKHFFDILKNGHNELSVMESRISVFHRDHEPYPDETCIYKYIEHSRNMLICNDKTVLIDFGEVSRISHINLTTTKTWLDNTSAVYGYIDMTNKIQNITQSDYMKKALILFNNFLDVELYNECYDYSISKLTSSDLSFKTNHHWHRDLIKDSNLVLINVLSNENHLHQKISDTIKQKCKVDTLSLIQFCYWSQGSHIPWHNDASHNGGITIYLNKSWDENWGGIFLFKDSDTITGIYPNPNRCIMQCGGISHTVVPTTNNSEIRLTIQVFF